MDDHELIFETMSVFDDGSHSKLLRLFFALCDDGTLTPKDWKPYRAWLAAVAIDRGGRR